MKKPFKILLFLFLAVLVAVAAGGYWFLQYRDYSRFKGPIQDAIGDALDRQVTIGGELSLVVSFHPIVVLGDVTLANAAWASQPVMANAGRLEARVSLLPLLAGRLDVQDIRLEDATVHLETRADGTGNWETEGREDRDAAAFPFRELELHRLEFSKVSLDFRDGASGTTYRSRLERLGLERGADPATMEVELAGDVDGRPVDISGTTGLPGDLVRRVRFPLLLRGSVGGTTVSVNGGIGDVFALEGFDLDLQVSGSDLSEVGESIHAPLPPTDRFSVKAHLSGNGNALRVSGMDGTIERLEHRADLTGDIGNLNAMDGVDLRFTGSGANLEELGPLIDETLPATGPFEIQGRLTGAAGGFALEDARLTAESGSLRFHCEGRVADISRGEGTDLDARLTGGSLAELGPFVGETLPVSGPFEISGRLAGPLEAIRLEGAEAVLSGDGYQLKASGSVTDLGSLEGMELAASAKGRDLAGFGRLFEIELPPSDRFEIRGRLSGSTETLALSDADASAGRAGLSAAFKGTVANLIDLSGIDGDASAAGDDLAAAGPLIGVDLPKTGAFEIYGRLKGDAGRLRLDRARGSVAGGGFRLVADGSVGDLVAMSGMRLSAKASGKDLAAFGRLFGAPLPRSERFEVSGELSGSPDSLSLSGAKGDAVVGGVEWALAGSIKKLIELEGAEFTATAAGKSLSQLGALMSVSLPDIGPFRVTARIAGSPSELDFRDVAATVDRSDLNGRVRFESGTRPRITARVRSALLDLTPLVKEAKQVEDDAKEEASALRTFFASGEPLPFDRLRAVDLDLTLEARGVRFRDADMTMGHLDFRVEKGDLRVDRLDVTHRATRLSGDLDIVAPGSGASPGVSFQFLAQQFDIGRFLREVRVETDVSGTIDVAASLKSSGQTPRALIAGANGTVGAVFGKGVYPKGLDLIAEDLSRRVIPFWGDFKTHAGRLNCGVMTFAVRDGIATAEAFLFDSERSLLTGTGKIDLTSQKIDFLLSPKPKDPSLFSMTTKLRVSGSVADPKVHPDPLSTAIKGAKALSFFALGPAGLLAPFVDLGALQRHACDVEGLQKSLGEVYQPKNGAER